MIIYIKASDPFLKLKCALCKCAGLYYEVIE